MVLYDFLAPGYDFFLGPIYAPFRRRAFKFLEIEAGARVLDLACGTGQNFSFFGEKIGREGTLVGVDVSNGMLRRARRKLGELNCAGRFLVRCDATQLLPSRLVEETRLKEVDVVVCAYGFSAMGDWEEAFRRSFALLRPGGVFFIHDIYAERRTLHVGAFEMATRVDLLRRSWEPFVGTLYGFSDGVY